MDKGTRKEGRATAPESTTLTTLTTPPTPPTPWTSKLLHFGAVGVSRWLPPVDGWRRLASVGVSQVTAELIQRRRSSAAVN